MRNQMINWICLTGLCLSTLLIYTCKKGIDPEEVKSPIDTVMLEPDEASEFLGLVNATIFRNPLQDANDGGIKVNVQDSAYTVKGVPLAASRFIFKHETDVKITGFYVAVKEASFYYDVPAYDAGNNTLPDADSLAVLVIDFQPEEVNFPYTIEIIIQPHGDDGIPLDEFERTITAEDPNDDKNTCSILDPCLGQLPIGCGDPNWEWDFTYQDDGYIYAPGVFRYAPEWIATGCCTNSGISISTVNNPQCNPNSTNATYKELPVTGTSHMRAFEILGLYEGGVYQRKYESSVQNIDLDKTDFCSEEVGYIHLRSKRQGAGNHDFTPGSTSLILNEDLTHIQGNLPFVHNGGEIIYTCHTLMFTEGLEIKSSHVYRRYAGLGFNDFSMSFWD